MGEIIGRKVKAIGQTIKIKGAINELCKAAVEAHLDDPQYPKSVRQLLNRAILEKVIVPPTVIACNHIIHPIVARPPKNGHSAVIDIEVETKEELVKYLDREYGRYNWPKGAERRLAEDALIEFFANYPYARCRAEQCESYLYKLIKMRRILEGKESAIKG